MFASEFQLRLLLAVPFDASLAPAVRTDYTHSTPWHNKYSFCKSPHSQCATQVMEGIGNAGPDNVSNAKPQALPVSPLLRIPAEIREKVWSYVFEDTVIHYPPKAGYVPFENFCKRYAVTYACKWIHHEATSILASKSTLYITRRDVTYPDLPHCLRSAVLPYVRNMVVHDYRTVESALRVPLDLSPILAAAPSLTKVQIGHFHLHGQSRKYYSDLQSHVRILHDMIHGQDSPEKRPNYARRQIHDFLDGVRLQDDRNVNRLEHIGGCTTSSSKRDLSYRYGSLWAQALCSWPRPP